MCIRDRFADGSVGGEPAGHRGVVQRAAVPVLGLGIGRGEDVYKRQQLTKRTDNACSLYRLQWVGSLPAVGCPLGIRGACT